MTDPLLSKNHRVEKHENPCYTHLGQCLESLKARRHNVDLALGEFQSL